MKLVDGGIVNIDYDKEAFKGCPTCDYGSSYITDLTVTLKNTLQVQLLMLGLFGKRDLKENQ